MKKEKRLLSAVLLVIFIFGLTACDKNILRKNFSPQQKFSLSMTADKSGKTFGADIICEGYSHIKIAFTYPDELSGFSLTATDTGYSINAFGVPDELQESEIKDNSLLNVLTGSIRMAVFSNHKSFTPSENGYTAQMLIDNIPVNISFTPDGYISSITAEAIDFSADFEKQG